MTENEAAPLRLWKDAEAQTMSSFADRSVDPTDGNNGQQMLVRESECQLLNTKGERRTTEMTKDRNEEPVENILAERFEKLLVIHEELMVKHSNLMEKHEALLKEKAEIEKTCNLALKEVKRLTDQLQDMEKRSIWRKILDAWDNCAWWKKATIIALFSAVSGGLGFAAESYLILSSNSAMLAEVGLFGKLMVVMSASAQFEAATYVAAEVALGTGAVLTTAAASRELLRSDYFQDIVKKLYKIIKEFAPKQGLKAAC